MLRNCEREVRNCVVKLCPAVSHICEAAKLSTVAKLRYCGKSLETASRNCDCETANHFAPIWALGGGQKVAKSLIKGIKHTFTPLKGILTTLFRNFLQFHNYIGSQPLAKLWFAVLQFSSNCETAGLNCETVLRSCEIATINAKLNRVVKLRFAVSQICKTGNFGQKVAKLHCETAKFAPRVVKLNFAVS